VWLFNLSRDKTDASRTGIEGEVNDRGKKTADVLKKIPKHHKKKLSQSDHA